MKSVFDFFITFLVYLECFSVVGINIVHEIMANQTVFKIKKASLSSCPYYPGHPRFSVQQDLTGQRTFYALSLVWDASFINTCHCLIVFLNVKLKTCIIIFICIFLVPLTFLFPFIFHLFYRYPLLSFCFPYSFYLLLSVWNTRSINFSSIKITQKWICCWYLQEKQNILLFCLNL